ncbi:accessory Sec system translocase SecA2 [Streptococcus sp. DD12]|uniref:accessory Sec system translocase SecA2 n=1 Tax=Streptococcus sp. DD12 TaxID=1777880 RepID=UPI0007939AD7|nr:accessory Sec system translocase SecA2 [Streptococcus sp. DD12]KXT76461.1 Protein export cytoplasm protein SecA2 ATPase RNA helicase [Streptococcus sp. DD12]
MVVKSSFSLSNRLVLRRLGRYLKKINALSDQMASLSDQALSGLTQEFKARLAQGESLDALLPEAFAAIREADKRVLGKFPYDVQVLGGLALHFGYIAEMKTGEGKTLTATLPLYVNALTGKGAILVTTNDYLAERDQKEMAPVYEFMGLTVGLAVFPEAVDPTPAMKRATYGSDIVYGTSAGLGFDYLSDNLAASKDEKFLPDFHYVIVDEADAIFLDNAQTPLIISGMPRVQSNLYDICHQFVLTLKADQEYHFNSDDKLVYLTGLGVAYAQDYFEVEDLYAPDYFELNRHINLALRAQLLYQRDVDYVVQDDKVELLDNRSGRVLDGTRLQSGIHQALETKEGVKKTADSRSMASVTYQSLFNLFPKLAGMTGTGKMAEAELLKTYGLAVVQIPTHRPIQRKDYPDAIYTTLPEKLQATLSFVQDCHAKGQPILLISGTVEIAEIYSRMLLREGIAHNVLTAKNVAKEAEIIAEAGQYQAVTVATSMAGRGTDIKLGPGVAERGGLAVIGTERMANSRIDWQLRGRAGRQGDPGLSQFFVSLEDELLVKHGGAYLARYLDKHRDQQSIEEPKALTRPIFRRRLALAQVKSEDQARQAREATIRFDESLRVQRLKVYRLRNQLIAGTIDLRHRIPQLVQEEVEHYQDKRGPLTLTALNRYILENFSYQLRQWPADFDPEDARAVLAYLMDLFEAEMKTKARDLGEASRLEEFYRLAVLRAIDHCWIAQVDSLQQLKNFVTSRSFAQRDAVMEYYRESFMSYEEMSQDIRSQIVRHVMLSQVEKTAEGDLSIYFV